MGDVDVVNLHQGHAVTQQLTLYPLTAVYQGQAPMHGKYMGALKPPDNRHGRCRAHYLECKIHLELVAFLEFLLEGSELGDVTEGGLLH